MISTAASRWETRIVQLASVVILIHAVDDALIDRDGASLGRTWAPLLLTVVIVVAANVLVPRMRPGLRAVAVLTLGVLALTNGMMHVIEVLTLGLDAGEVTGVLEAGAGAALILLAAAIPYAHRNAFRTSRLAVWRNRGLAALGVFVWTVAVLIPVVIAIVQGHQYRRTIEDPPSAAYHDVSFRSSDGLRLSGWYVPSHNGAAIVLVSSARGDRNGSIAHARLLARHGYGVLLYDARGSGRSEGTSNGYGWAWDRDVEGALDFLSERPDVERNRLGALGLSTGADVLLEVAATDHRIKAVVADGATARSVADIPDASLLEKASFAPMFLSLRLLTGTAPGPPLVDLVPRAAPTPLLLIASGTIPQELPANVRYAAAARGPVTLWQRPRGAHTRGIWEEPDRYERRVVTAFDEGLRASQR